MFEFAVGSALLFWILAMVFKFRFFGNMAQTALVGALIIGFMAPKYFESVSFMPITFGAAAVTPSSKIGGVTDESIGFACPDDGTTTIEARARNIEETTQEEYIDVKPDYIRVDLQGEVIDVEALNVDLDTDGTYDTGVSVNCDGTSNTEIKAYIDSEDFATGTESWIGGIYEIGNINKALVKKTFEIMKRHEYSPQIIGFDENGDSLTTTAITELSSVDDSDGKDIFDSDQAVSAGDTIEFAFKYKINDTDAVWGADTVYFMVTYSVDFDDVEFDHDGYDEVEVACPARLDNDAFQQMTKCWKIDNLYVRNKNERFTISATAKAGTTINTSDDIGIYGAPATLYRKTDGSYGIDVEDDTASENAINSIFIARANLS